RSPAVRGLSCEAVCRSVISNLHQLPHRPAEWIAESISETNQLQHEIRSCASHRSRVCKLSSTRTQRCGSDDSSWIKRSCHLLSVSWPTIKSRQPRYLIMRCVP